MSELAETVRRRAGTRAIDEEGAVVRPVDAVNWAARRLLPALLDSVGYPDLGTVLRDVRPVSATEMRDRYALSRRAKTIQLVRAHLIDELNVEWQWARREFHPLAVPVPDLGSRSAELPQLAQLLAFVTKTFPTANFGKMLTSCIELTIELAALRRANDDPSLSHSVPPEIREVYRAAAAALVSTDQDWSKPPRSTTPKSAQVVLVRDPEDRWTSFEGQVVTALSTRSCRHKHQDYARALACARHLLRERRTASGGTESGRDRPQRRGALVSASKS